ncbi:MAG: secondary thiamine-phosphate synthase enzyme YjbQ [Phycisphaerae bacterium]|nr:secondary thiamine-phosphate synthase enzyme YjbQ [Phycisphaerae bacterium]MDW8263117.1 secondary thiamine-phosphate synthase enzyme YjbQ [Phycisphaerales bacterium]
MRIHRPVTESLESSSRLQMIDVTSRVQKHLAAAGVRDGLAIVFVPHTTAGVVLQENADPNTQHDLIRKLEAAIPQLEAFYQHDEGNSDAHVKSALTGNSVTIPIADGKLLLGRWQAIFFCEFDGPRERRLLLKFLDEGE